RPIFDLYALSLHDALPISPAGMLLLQLHDRLLDLEGELAGMAVGPSGAIRQAIHPTVLVPAKDLVAGLAGDPELPAQHRHLLPVDRKSTRLNSSHSQISYA